MLAVTLSAGTAFADPGKLFTTDKTGTAVNENIYGLSTDEYIGGGPKTRTLQVRRMEPFISKSQTPEGVPLLSTDNAVSHY